MELTEDTLKICYSCGQAKLHEDFYSKGLRRDSNCKSCTLSKKKKSYKEQKQKERSLRKMRLKSKMLTVKTLQVSEIYTINSDPDISKIENLLIRFIFNSVRNRGDNFETRKAC